MTSFNATAALSYLVNQPEQALAPIKRRCGFLDFVLLLNFTMSAKVSFDTFLCGRPDFALLCAGTTIATSVAVEVIRRVSANAEARNG